jgi:tetratricopeptide (TPR) repeat protein
MVGAPAATVAIVGGVLLWRSSATPALTEADSVVLADFTNRTGDTMFDGTLSEALGGQLRQSTFLKVYPEQQVQATLRLMGQDPMAGITPEIGRDLCQRLGGKALLGGSISAIGSSYLLSLTAQDCVTGAIVAEEQAQAANKDGVLKALGEASSAFRMKLGESLASVARNDARIEMATTPSLDALKAYSQGMATRRTKGDFDSIPFFKRALELDESFALAQARISTVYSNVGEPDLSKKHGTRAYELRDRVSDRERYYIEARYFTTVQPDIDKAVDAYTRLLAAYPGDYAALANLASLQQQQGQIAAAIANFEAAIKSAPDQPLPRQNLGFALAALQRYDEARRVYEEALKLQDATSTRLGLFQVAILTGDQALAEAQEAAMRGRRDVIGMTSLRLQALAYQGRLDAAAAAVPEYERAMTDAQRTQGLGDVLINVALAEALAGRSERARERMAEVRRRKALTLSNSDDRMVLAAALGDTALAQEALPEALKQVAQSPPALLARNESAIHAMHAMAARDYMKALALLEPLGFDGRTSFTALLFAESAVAAGRSGDVARACEWLLSTDARLGFGIARPYITARLAHAYAALGRTAEARKRFDEFFAMWKDADPDLPLVVKARAAYAKLGP